MDEHRSFFSWKINRFGLKTLEGELIDLGVKYEILEKSGSWYSYQGNRLGQGKENVREFLKENKDISQAVEAKIRDVLIPAVTAQDQLDKVTETVDGT